MVSLQCDGMIKALVLGTYTVYSHETAMLRLWSDILEAADRRQVTLLGLLDLSAAFDCVDHDILLHRLEIGLGLSDVVLGWIQSFLTNRTPQVTFNGQLSSKQSLSIGVPQGSVLGAAAVPSVHC